MKLNKSLQKPLQNVLKSEVTLYIVAVVAITNVIYYLYHHRIEEMVVFAILGYITSMYSKNMTVILGVATLGTNLMSSYNDYYANGKNKNIMEGMENKKKKKQEEAEAEEEEEEAEDEVQGAGQEDDDEEDEIDIINTQKESFADLSSILGKGGLKNLTKETKDLINQQKSLMETFKDITPMIESAQKAMNGMNSFNLEGSLGNLSEISKNLGGFMGKNKKNN